MIIEQSTQVVLSTPYEQLCIDSDQDIELSLKAVCNTNVYINVMKAKSLVITSEIEEGLACTYLVWNSSKESVNTKDYYKVGKDAELKLAYGDCNTSEVSHEVVIDLVAEGAKGTIKSATLCQAKKKYTIDVNSLVPHTEGIIENYSVVLPTGNYTMVATGSIAKGAYQSVSHQTSRALTMDEGLNAVILPKLLIDENDVQASHATSVGRIDENQLIYLQSRGLTEGQVLNLISTGYLMPIASFIENEQLQNQLKEEIESKVSASCSM